MLNSKSTYIVAVSGGVDSVVLLHKMLSHKSPDNPNAPKFIVAHFDHGIRDDSTLDAEFVRLLAEKHDLEFELGNGKLGPGASEAAARDARYEFLRTVAKKHDASMIVTAHHQDDVLETMIINMVRGTGPRGLGPMSSSIDILRPLLNSTKQELIQYANDNELEWREDPSNSDEKYLRNYIRANVTPKLGDKRGELLNINKKVSELYHDIDTRISILLPKKNMLSRAWFVALPYAVQKELMRAWLVRCGVSDIDSKLIERCTIASKTLSAGKKIDVSGELWLVSEKENVLLTSK